MKKCRMCENEVYLFHKGTRDREDIDIFKCSMCGLLQTSTLEHITDELYENGGMIKNQYNSREDAISDYNWDSWIEETRVDDERRVDELEPLILDKVVCDFGCGNGGFVRHIVNKAKEVCAVELNEESRRRISKEGITISNDIKSFPQNYFDVITCFQVIEHLADPQSYLQLIKSRLKKGGLFVVETPNANDALISKYDCEAFKNFTFWSEHVYLYNSHNLEELIKSQGFEIVQNSQVQRYPLSNHLFWLAKGTPGGHMRWNAFDSDGICREYANVLRKEGICDTLWIVSENE